MVMPLPQCTLSNSLLYPWGSEICHFTGDSTWLVLSAHAWGEGWPTEGRVVSASGLSHCLSGPQRDHREGRGGREKGRS